MIDNIVVTLTATWSLEALNETVYTKYAPVLYTTYIIQLLSQIIKHVNYFL